jgi:hypothetical protein
MKPETMKLKDSIALTLGSPETLSEINLTTTVSIFSLIASF